MRWSDLLRENLVGQAQSPSIAKKQCWKKKKNMEEADFRERELDRFQDT